MTDTKYLKTRLLILVALVLLALHVASPLKTATACEYCVFPTGGICVGCMEHTRGYQVCTPIQETCSCNVSGACPADCPLYPCDKEGPPPNNNSS